MVFWTILREIQAFSEYGLMEKFIRILTLPKKHHFFLLGARNTGKSTLILNQFKPATTFTIDLLDSEQEERFAKSPNELFQIVSALPDTITHVVIDEIQKLPKLLDTVQRLMQSTKKYFVLTGSSARKLKSGGANLLAGRAFVYHLFPLTSSELSLRFDLETALQWGTLPDIYLVQNNQERGEFLHAYAHTYLKEEIWGEHLIRKLDPFRRFLEVAAQSNGTILNYKNIARDVGVDDKTVHSYYSILEDTLVGFFLESFHHSIRKRVNHKPKFYFFDPGVVRALARLTTVPLQPQTHAYGKAFEHFVILECMRLADYHRKEFRFSYLRTINDVEIDLIVERPGKNLLCIEIKSATQVLPESVSAFARLCRDIPNSEAICLSNDKYAKQIDNVLVMPWQQGLKEYFGGE
jgi:predicted AAA+ superfamily ATPase